jgi:PAS domain S-box-containing protein
MINKEYFEKTRDLLAIVGADGQFHELSKAWESVLGWSISELKSKKYQELLHPDDRERTKYADDKYRDKNIRSAYLENRYRHKNGGYIWLQWDGYLMEDKRMYAVSRDVTILKEKEFFFNEVQKLAKIGCWKIDLDNNEIILSDEIGRIYEEEIGSSLKFEKAVGFYPVEFREIIFKKVSNLIKNSEPFDLELPFKTASGKIKTVKVTGRSTEKNGIKEVYGLFQDITDQILKENELDLQRAKSIQASKMASLGEMAANIAHEINNPLSLIQGRAEHLLDKLNINTSSKEELTGGLQQIQRTSDRIAKIVRSLGAFSKAGQSAFIRLPLKSVVEDFLGLCAEKLKNEGYQLVLSEIPNVKVDCRGPELSHVFLNLVNNSVEALRKSNEKWIKIDFEQKPNILLISFSDNGKGIDKSIQDKIMQPFFTTTENGSGLGLSISSGIIKNHKGKFYLDEQQSKTTFCIELPYAK